MSSHSHSTAGKSSLSIIWRDDADRSVYEQARTGRQFNKIVPERHPLAVVSIKSEQEIVEAVALAISLSGRISVRSGGHSFPAWSLQDDTILLDLGEYSEISFDESTGIVRASPSMTVKHLNEYLSGKGRMFPVGHCPEVGLGGYLLGGGMGWNSNNWGWACESIVAIDVVTASGELIRVDAQQNSDLFWAAKGGGPAFPGVVTRFHLQTRPTPTVIRSSGYIFPAEHYRSALGWAVKIASTLENSIEIAAVGSYKEGIDKPCITIAMLAFGDSEDDINNLLRAADQSKPTGILSEWFCRKTTLQQEIVSKAETYPADTRYTVDSAFLVNDADVVKVLEPAFTTLPTRQSLALWSSMVPRSRKALTGMALSVQSDHYFTLCVLGENETDDQKCQSWISGIMENVGQNSVGSYLNETDFNKRPSKWWGKEQCQSLLDIKRKWDPSGRISGCPDLLEALSIEQSNN